MEIIIFSIVVENDVCRFRILITRNDRFFLLVEHSVQYPRRIVAVRNAHCKQDDVINLRRAYECTCTYMFLSIVRITSQTSKWHVGFIINQVSMRLCKYLIFFFLTLSQNSIFSRLAGTRALFKTHNKRTTRV